MHLDSGVVLVTPFWVISFSPRKDFTHSKTEEAMSMQSGGLLKPDDSTPDLARWMVHTYLAMQKYSADTGPGHSAYWH